MSNEYTQTISIDLNGNAESNLKKINRELGRMEGNLKMIQRFQAIFERSGNDQFAKQLKRNADSLGKFAIQYEKTIANMQKHINKTYVDSFNAQKKYLQQLAKLREAEAKQREAREYKANVIAKNGVTIKNVTDKKSGKTSEKYFSEGEPISSKATLAEIDKANKKIDDASKLVSQIENEYKNLGEKLTKTNRNNLIFDFDQELAKGNSPSEAFQKVLNDLTKSFESVLFSYEEWAEDFKEITERNRDISSNINQAMLNMDFLNKDQQSIWEKNQRQYELMKRYSGERTLHSSTSSSTEEALKGLNNQRLYINRGGRQLDAWNNFITDVNDTYKNDPEFLKDFDAVFGKLDKVTSKDGTFMRPGTIINRAFKNEEIGDKQRERLEGLFSKGNMSDSASEYMKMVNSRNDDVSDFAANLEQSNQAVEELNARQQQENLEAMRNRAVRSPFSTKMSDWGTAYKDNLYDRADNYGKQKKVYDNEITDLNKRIEEQGGTATDEQQAKLDELQKSSDLMGKQQAKANGTATAISLAEETFKAIGDIVEGIGDTFEKISGISFDIKDIFNDIVSEVAKVLDTYSGAATYDTGSSLITNSAARETQMKYGLSSSQTYALTQTMTLLGMSSDEDLVYMNSNQQALFSELMEKYSTWYDKMESSGMLESIQEAQLEFEMFKQEISYKFLNWFSENSDEIMSIVETIMNVIEWIFDLLTWFMGDSNSNSSTTTNAAYSASDAAYMQSLYLDAAESSVQSGSASYLSNGGSEASRNITSSYTANFYGNTDASDVTNSMKNYEQQMLMDLDNFLGEE